MAVFDVLGLGMEVKDLEALKDHAVGIRNRRWMAQARQLAAEKGVNPDAMMGWIRRNGLPPLESGEGKPSGSIIDWLNSGNKRADADKLGIDWDSLTEFMNALVPMIILLMESSSAI